MAVFWQKQISEYIRVFIWQIKEPLAELANHLLDQEKEELTQILNSQKRLEYAAVRNLLQAVAQKENFTYSPIQKTETGKPFFRDIPLQISISHAFPFVAVALQHQHLAIGIDIEQKQTKIQRVASRVFSDKELFWAENNLHLLTQLWTAKEAIYKAYSLKRLIFKENILCNFCSEKQNFCKGYVQKSDFEAEYCLEHYAIGENHHLCVAFR